MAKVFQQGKKDAIIFCPQHGRLTTQENLGSVSDGAGCSHYYHLAYCPACSCYYATERQLPQLMDPPNYKGVPIRIVAALSVAGAKRREEELKQAALTEKRLEQLRHHRAVESKADQELWAEIFAPQEADFAQLYAASLHGGSIKEAGKKAEPAAPAKQQPQAAAKAAIRQDPYQKQQPLDVEEIFLMEKTLTDCPADQRPLMDKVARLQLRNGGEKKISGRVCPACGRFYAHRKTYQGLRLPAKELLTAIREQLPEADSPVAE